MDGLKPCPFCGGEPDEYEGEYGNGIYCMQCGAMVGEPIHLGFNIAERVSYEQAIEAWNTRVKTVTVTVITTVTDTPQITYVPWRTCQQEERGWGTEGDHARVWLTCGHDCMVPTVQDLPNYCPTCGCRVVGE